MRLNITLKHPGLVIAASLFGLAACGGADKTDASIDAPAPPVADTPTTSTHAPTTTDSAKTIAAHVHGDAELSVTRSDESYTIELFSPVANFGASEAETDVEALSAAISDSLGGESADDVLDAFAQHFVWPQAADCTFNNGREIYSFDGDHANATLIATFHCGNADAADALQVDLLNLSGIEEIDAIALIDDTQITDELTSTQRILDLK
jgi:hypothetical protein